MNEDSFTPHRGEIFRSFRAAWGLSTRAVEAKSRVLAELWDSPAYILDASYISKIESGERSIINMSMAKMVSSCEILSKGSRTLFDLCRPLRQISLVEDVLGAPVKTQGIKEGRLAETVSALVAAASCSVGPSTEATQATGEYDNRESASYPFRDRRRFLRIVIGRQDIGLAPLIVPGALVIVDREVQEVPRETAYQSDLERPIFVVEIESRMFCCFCHTVGDGCIQIVRSSFVGLSSRVAPPPLIRNHNIKVVGAVAYLGVDRRPYTKG